MSKQEIEVIADEIASAINQGRFNEAAKKFCESSEEGLLQEVESRVGRYELQRFNNLVDQIWVQEIKNENL